MLSPGWLCSTCWTQREVKGLHSAPLQHLPASPGAAAWAPSPGRLSSAISTSSSAQLQIHTPTQLQASSWLSSVVEASGKRKRDGIGGSLTQICALDISGPQHLHLEVIVWVGFPLKQKNSGTQFQEDEGPELPAAMPVQVSLVLSWSSSLAQGHRCCCAWDLGCLGRAGVESSAHW